jgi:hydrogenase maturation protein HypF
LESLIARYLLIKGLVQGVGFRPFIYRLAVKNDLSGWVLNGNDGVRVHIEGRKDNLEHFLSSIRQFAPQAASIREIIIEDTPAGHFQEFAIRKSEDLTAEITEISPDIAVCDECLEDMKLQEHRMEYPFINCTNCGPRFTIIRDLPYDRAKTTMSGFIMCSRCHTEYSDILDRRFHAQPVACKHCGPVYELIHEHKIIQDITEILHTTCRLIENGKVVAIKGMGGFHLACDATNEKAVRRLRARKYREGKPFAVMFGNLDTARQYLKIGPDEEKSLVSWRRPVVILQNEPDGKSLAPGVSNGFNTTGTMLPYMPFHHMLFKELSTSALVMTSGNLSDEPIIIDNQGARNHLKQVADAFLTYNRDIFNRTDDSVVMFEGGKERLIRRSRGFVPSPFHIPQNVDGIFAAGAELVNCFCIGRGHQAIMSQHIGDLQNIETLDFYAESFSRFRQMFRVSPTHIVSDLHPDYLSTTFSEEYALRHGDLPVLKVQHHHAHIASCMVENGLDEPVIGISLDGVGLGTDGNIWGFEVMKADYAGFERLSHLEYLEQPGGDKTTHEPWRMALSYICRYLGHDADISFLKFYSETGQESIDMVRKAIRFSINAPLTSSAGRLFDAIAAMTGLCTHSAFHAEAPMRLENIINEKEKGEYIIAVGETLDPGEMIRDIYLELRNHTPVPDISAKFHRAVVSAIVKSAKLGREKSGIDKVVLSGGVFQNRFILSNSITELERYGFTVYTHSLFPSNDGGIALGQIAIAARKREYGIF